MISAEEQDNWEREGLQEGTGLAENGDGRALIGFINDRHCPNRKTEGRRGGLNSQQDADYV